MLSESVVGHHQHLAAGIADRDRAFRSLLKESRQLAFVDPAELAKRDRAAKTMKRDGYQAGHNFHEWLVEKG